MPEEHDTTTSLVSLPPSFTAPAHSIDHVAIAVEDPEVTAGWYQRNLGFTIFNDEIIREGLNVRLLFLSPSPGLGDCSLQLISPIGNGPVADYLTVHGEGLHHLCLAVPNITKALTDLGEPISQVFSGGFGMPCAFLREAAPTGVRIELVERHPAPA